MVRTPSLLARLALVACVAAAVPVRADVAAGIDFLAGSQRADGTWGDPGATGLRDTATVVDALPALGRRGSLAHVLGVGALAGAAPPNLDYLARAVVPLADAGAPVGLAVDQLLAAQNPELTDPAFPDFPGAGWGVAAGYGNETVSTALVLEALGRAGLAAGLVVTGGSVASGTPVVHGFDLPAGATGLTLFVRAVTGTVRVTIGFPDTGSAFVDVSAPASFGLDEQAGHYTLTVESLAGSPNAYDLDVRFVGPDGFDVGHVTTPLQFLGAMQNQDGSFPVTPGDEGHALATLQALLALQHLRPVFDGAPAIARGIDWLLANRHNLDGGFGSDPGASTVDETALATMLLCAADPRSPALPGARAFLASRQEPDGSWDGDPYRSALALRALVCSCLLDADLDGAVTVGTDVVYFARRLLGFLAVPPTFRALDAAIPPAVDVDGKIDAAAPALDVDGNGAVDVGTDLVYVARRRLGLTPVPPGFRILDPTIPSDQTIGDAVDALCP
jgi:Squalene-hopene cyclase C-terminal domain/Prenyltransferase and squalene oxidase repeat